MGFILAVDVTNDTLTVLIPHSFTTQAKSDEYLTWPSICCFFFLREVCCQRQWFRLGWDNEWAVLHILQASFKNLVLSSVKRATAGLRRGIGSSGWNPTSLKIDCPSDDRLSFTQELTQAMVLNTPTWLSKGLNLLVMAWRPQHWRNKVKGDGHNPWVTSPSLSTWDAWRSLLQGYRWVER